jgi:oligopeptide/dipeptide ABC transporter ATP-binding protein
LLRVENLKTYFDVSTATSRHATVRAVDGVDLVLNRGEALGLVGESGSGKSTVARTIMRLDKPTSGRIIFDGVDLATLSQSQLRPLRRRVQMVFQDPYASLNPRMRVGEIVAEPIILHEKLSERDAITRATELLERVGLPSAAARRYPHEFSGGQRQRIGVARALAVRPDLVVADEPVSALDVSIQAQLLNLLKDLQRDFGLTYLFISHDLSVVRYVCDRIAIMYLGRIAEEGDNEAIFSAPRHPYTQALLSAIPIADPDIEQHRELILLDDEMPSPISPPSGCRFHTRCPIAQERCATHEPTPVTLSPTHWAACHRVLDPENEQLAAAGR